MESKTDFPGDRRLGVDRPPQFLDGAGLQGGKLAVEPGSVGRECAWCVDFSAGPQLRGDRSVAREDRGEAGDDDGPDADLGREAADVLRPGTAEREEREPARVAPAPDGHRPDG